MFAFKPPHYNSANRKQGRINTQHIVCRTRGESAKRKQLSPHTVGLAGTERRDMFGVKWVESKWTGKETARKKRF